jgi:hypothetical protein
MNQILHRVSGRGEETSLLADVTRDQPFAFTAEESGTKIA